MRSSNTSIFAIDSYWRCFRASKPRAQESALRTESHRVEFAARDLDRRFISESDVNRATAHWENVYCSIQGVWTSSIGPRHRCPWPLGPRLCHLLARLRSLLHIDPETRFLRPPTQGCTGYWSARPRYNDQGCTRSVSGPAANEAPCSRGVGAVRLLISDTVGASGSPSVGHAERAHCQCTREALSGRRRRYEHDATTISKTRFLTLAFVGKSPPRSTKRMAALRIGYVREHFSSPLLQLAAQSDYIQLVECPSEPLPRRGLSFRSGPSNQPYTGPQVAPARSCLA